MKYTEKIIESSVLLLVIIDILLVDIDFPNVSSTCRAENYFTLIYLFVSF